MGQKFSENSVVSRVRWAELLPDEFVARRDACPVVLIPYGLCEPHGHVAALGLDLLKAEYYCDEAARRFGGVVAPAQGYHIHECGFHAPWLAETIGENNPLMAGMPPHVVLHHFLYQLRAFAHAGFKAAIGVSGHAGGSQEDLRSVGAAFEEATGMRVMFKTDPEWAGGKYAGDHAGKYEISQLLAIRPDLVDLGKIGRGKEPGSGGRLAIGDDAADASLGFGKEVNETVLEGLGRQVESFRTEKSREVNLPDYSKTEKIWSRIAATRAEWRSLRPYPDQKNPPPSSRWHEYTNPRLDF